MVKTAVYNFEQFNFEFAFTGVIAINLNDRERL